MSRYNRNVSFIPEDRSGFSLKIWSDDGRQVGPVTHHGSIFGSHDTCDVVDPSGTIHKDVTVILREDKRKDKK